MRLLLFVSIFLCFFVNFVWLAIPLSVYYAWRYVGYELFLIGFLVDGYFGAFAVVPVYSMLMTVIVLLVNLLAPVLLVYNRET